SAPNRAGGSAHGRGARPRRAGPPGGVRRSRSLRSQRSWRSPRRRHLRPERDGRDDGRTDRGPFPSWFGTGMEGGPPALPPRRPSGASGPPGGRAGRNPTDRPDPATRKTRSDSPAETAAGQQGFLYFTLSGLAHFAKVPDKEIERDIDDRPKARREAAPMRAVFGFGAQESAPIPLSAKSDLHSMRDGIPYSILGPLTLGRD